MKHFYTLLLVSLTGLSAFAQDPELLMNEGRYALRIHTHESQGSKSFSAGPSVGLNGSLWNLIFENFNKKRFRMGDLIGGDVCPLGYSNSSNAPFPIFVWARADFGLQGYYALKEDLDFGLKAYYQLGADWDLISTGLVIQPVVRYKNLIAESSLGIGNKPNYKHYQAVLKYIILHEDALHGIFIRYENTHDPDATAGFKNIQLSLGYSIHFSSNR